METATSYQHVLANVNHRLKVTILQAQLPNLNVAIGHLYVRLKFGQFLYKTKLMKGAAQWNEEFECVLPSGVTCFGVQIIDKRRFMKKKILAWCEAEIPSDIFRGKTLNTWYALNGDIGIGQNGYINVTLQQSWSAIQSSPIITSPLLVRSMSFTKDQENKRKQDITQIHAMFPSLSKEVICSVLETKGGNQELAIETLLEMGTDI
ncbi:toll-interacting protein B-like isoform X2 [Tachypleus tridentatus]|uniref:toll-interacting protein B-like isoform X2 n=1 Tax=Tachypleus tridentatus TaxID=6853 RepID=UPI003FD07219